MGPFFYGDCGEIDKKSRRWLTTASVSTWA